MSFDGLCIIVSLDIFSSMNIDQGQGADLWSIRSLFFIKRKFKQFHQYQQNQQSPLTLAHGVVLILW